MAERNFIARSAQQFKNWRWRANRKVKSKAEALEALNNKLNDPNIHPKLLANIPFLKERLQAELTSAQDKLINIDLDRAKMKEISKMSPPINASEEVRKQFEFEKKLAQEAYEEAVKIRDKARENYKQYARDYAKFQIKKSDANKISRAKNRSEDSKIDHDILQALMKNSKWMPLEEAQKFKAALEDFKTASKIRDNIRLGLESAEANMREMEKLKTSWIRSWRPTPKTLEGFQNKISDLRDDRDIVNSLMKKTEKTPAGMRRLAEQLQSYEIIKNERDKLRRNHFRAEYNLEISTQNLTEKLTKKFKKQIKAQGEKDTKRIPNRAKEQTENALMGLQKVHTLLKTEARIGSLVNLTRDELAYVQGLRNVEAAKLDYVLAKEIMKGCGDPNEFDKVKEKLEVLNEIRALRDEMADKLTASEKLWADPTRKRSLKENISDLDVGRVSKSQIVRDDEGRRVEYQLSDYNVTQKMFEDLQQIKPLTLEALNKVKEATITLNKARSVRDGIVDDLKAQELALQKSRNRSPKERDRFDKQADNFSATQKKIDTAPDASTLFQLQKQRSNEVELFYNKKDIQMLKMTRMIESSKSDLIVIAEMIKDSGESYKSNPSKLASLESRIQAFSELRGIRNALRDNLDIAEANFLTPRKDFGFRKGGAEKDNEKRIYTDARNDFEFAQKMMDKLKPPAEATLEKINAIKEQLQVLTELREYRDKLRTEIFKIEIERPKINFIKGYVRLKDNPTDDDFRQHHAVTIRRYGKKSLKYSQVNRQAKDATLDHEFVSIQIRELEKFIEKNSDEPAKIKQKVAELKETFAAYELIRVERNLIRDELDKAEKVLNEAKTRANVDFSSRRVHDLKHDYEVTQKMMKELKPPITLEQAQKFKEKLAILQEARRYRDGILNDLKIHLVKHEKYEMRKEKSGQVSEKTARLMAKHSRRIEDVKNDHDYIRGLIKEAEADPSKLAGLKGQIELYKQAIALRDKLRVELEKTEKHGQQAEAGMRKTNHLSLASDLKSDYEFIKRRLEEFKAAKPISETSLQKFVTVMEQHKALTDLRKTLLKNLGDHEVKYEQYFKRKTGGITTAQNERLLEKHSRRSVDGKRDYEFVSKMIKDAEKAFEAGEPEKLAAIQPAIMAYQSVCQMRNELRTRLEKAEKSLLKESSKGYQYYKLLREDLKGDYEFTRSLMEAHLKPDSITKDKIQGVTAVLSALEQVREFRNTLLKDFIATEKSRALVPSKMAMDETKEVMVANSNRKIADLKNDLLLSGSLIRDFEKEILAADPLNPAAVLQKKEALMEVLSALKDVRKIRDNLRDKLGKAAVNYQDFGGDAKFRRREDLEGDYKFAQAQIATLTPPLTVEKIAAVQMKLNSFNELKAERDKILGKYEKYSNTANWKEYWQDFGSNPTQAKRRRDDAKIDHAVFSAKIRMAENDPEYPRILEQIKREIKLYKEVMNQRDKILKKLENTESKTAVWGSTQEYNKNMARNLNADHQMIQDMMSSEKFKPLNEEKLKALKDSVEAFNKLTAMRDEIIKDIKKYQHEATTVMRLPSNYRNIEKSFNKNMAEDCRSDLAAARAIINGAQPQTKEGFEAAQERMKELKEIQKDRDKIRSELMQTQKDIKDNEKAIKANEKNIQSTQASLAKAKDHREALKADLRKLKENKPDPKNKIKYAIWLAKVARKERQIGHADNTVGKLEEKLKKYQDKKVDLEFKKKELKTKENDLTQDYRNLQKYVHNVSQNIANPFSHEDIKRDRENRNTERDQLFAADRGTDDKLKEIQSSRYETAKNMASVLFSEATEAVKMLAEKQTQKEADLAKKLPDSKPAESTPDITQADPAISRMRPAPTHPGVSHMRPSEAHAAVIDMKTPAPHAATARMEPPPIHSEPLKTKSPQQSEVEMQPMAQNPPASKSTAALRPVPPAKPALVPSAMEKSPPEKKKTQSQIKKQPVSVEVELGIISNPKAGLSEALSNVSKSLGNLQKDSTAMSASSRPAATAAQKSGFTTQYNTAAKSGTSFQSMRSEARPETAEERKKREEDEAGLTVGGSRSTMSPRP